MGCLCACSSSSSSCLSVLRLLHPPAAGPSVYMLSVIIIAIPFGTEHTRSSKHNRIREWLCLLPPHSAFLTPFLATFRGQPAYQPSRFPPARTLIKCKSSSLSCPTKIWPKRHGAHFEHISSISSNAPKTCQHRFGHKKPTSAIQIIARAY